MSSDGAQMDGRNPERREPVRVVYLSTAFPKPGAEALGPWGLRQVHALRRHGAEVLVVSCTTWVPKWLGRLGVKRATAECPREHDWNGVRAAYPRWLYTQRGDDADIVYNHPAIFNGLGWLTGRAGLLRIVRDFRPDIIHAHHMTPNGLTALRLKRATGVPFVLTEHNIKELPHYRERPRRRAVGERVVREASRWIALGKPVEAHMLAAYPWARTEIIPNGTDRPSLGILEAKPTRALSGKLVLTCVAGFYPVKNLPRLVRAFGRVAPQHPSAVLRVCGDGEQRAEIETAIKEVGLQNRITLLGAVSHANAMREMAMSDGFVLVSINDTYPTVCLEAASVGTPVIWPSDNAVGDQFVDGLHGYAVDPRDEGSIARGLDRLLADQDARVRMRVACSRLFEEELSWDVAAPRLVSLYRDVISEARACERRAN